MKQLIRHLREYGILPTVQRLAVAEFILATEAHPSADTVWEKVKDSFPTMSRATVYNTLNLFVEKGLIQRQLLREGTVVFDAMNTAHHHFIDEDSGQIYDIPWDAIEVRPRGEMDGFDVHEYQVVMRGCRTKNG
ncbi:MAG: transcriptional repressor [bacterium]